MKRKLRTYAFLIQYLFKKTAYYLKRKLPGIGKFYAQHFPATHLTPDRWQYLFNFSSELLVTVLVIGFAAFQFVFFFLKPDFHDNSLAVTFLKHHVTFNEKLYARNSSIKTAMASSNSFVPAAYADAPATGITADTTAADGGQSTSDGTDEQSFLSQDTEGGSVTMVRPNPDSVADLVAKQIKIHTVKRTDTVYTLSREYGISVKTIQQVNHLNGIEIKEGWQLLMLPTDGVLVKADSNTTLPDIAKKYHAPNETEAEALDKIIRYNALADAEDINAGQYIIVPGGVMPAPPAAPKPKPKPGSSGPSGAEGLEDQGGHDFPWGYCTWYVAHKRKIPWGGNAKSWLGNARAMGYETGSKPVVGAIGVTTESTRYGHVYIVEKVNDNGTFEVSEMNYDHFGKVDSRTVNNNDRHIKGFIYWK